MIANQNNPETKAAPRSTKSHLSTEWVIPEIIEEKRKRSDGRVVCNRYATGKLLGKGGFAKVFVGTLLPSKQEYALKIVSKASLTKDRARLKLQSEIKIHKVLDHENVVRFDRCFEDPNYYYLLMELCDNQSMTSLLEQRKRITEPEMRYYLKQLVHSLQYLRDNLVIHRDLKLGNLFLDNQMRIKVGDFGLAAKLNYETERKKTVCGTPNYIAPEILKSDTGHSFEVDIWSTGVILYTLLVGRPPFQCKDVKTTYERILSNVYNFPDHVMVSSEAKSLINKMLQHYPGNRIALNEVLEHSFFTAPHAFTPTTLPESSLKHCPHIEDITPKTTFSHFSKLSNMIDEKKSRPVLGDENDPHALNKANARPTLPSTTNKPIPAMKLHTENNSNAVPKISPSGAYSRPKSAGPLQRKAYQQKFDIFDEQTEQKTPSLPSRLSEPKLDSSPNVKTVTPVSEHSKPFLPQQELADLKARAYRVLKTDANADLNQVQAGLQQVHLDDKPETPLDNPPKRSREAWTSSSSPSAPPAPSTNVLRVATPPEQIMKPRDLDNLKAPNTLETVHDMLSSHTFSTTMTAQHQISSANTTQTQLHSQTVDLYGAQNKKKVVPQVWVIRYVDYTSKYGLGFLLNNGSAGVNFNDSTKIVLSADGKIFQYYERKRTGGGSEHVGQSHFLDSYPAELHKKVTLLKHFRNYLLEEEKNSKAGQSKEDPSAEQQAAALRYAFSKDSLAEESKVPSASVPHDRKMLEDEPELPFVKKYIRTKHAILFRLSNHTVQMVFYDRSEILLSSEAKYITYVNKAGQRSDHYLEDSMLSERPDISQRLKYTKDIMHRLITMQ